MKTKLFTLLLAVAASVGTMLAEIVQIGDLYYNLDATNQTAVVARNSSASGEIIIPSSVTYNSVSYIVTSIGSWAFESCTGLTSVGIPNSVTSIGSSAFSYCRSLTSVEIPNSVTSIGNYAFENCTGLTSINVETSNLNYCSVEGVLFNKDKTELIQYPIGNSRTEYVIPNSVTSIGNAAFRKCSGLTSVEITNSVTSIGNSAFYGCTGLTSVTIPNSVTSIGGSAFSSCSGLTSIEIPNSVTSIGNYAFENCTGLTSVTIGNSVTNIGDGAFKGCRSLTSMTIPNSVTSIGNYAFGSCTALTSITIPNSAAVVDLGVIDGCTNITSVTAPASIFEVAEGNWINYTRSLQSVTLTNGELTYNVLGVLARSYRTLTHIDISGASNTELADEAFKGYYNLQTLILPSDLTTIGYMAVADCKNLQSINIPASVTEISQSAFENCRSLQSITFGESTNSASNRHNMLASSNSQLRTIGNWAFYNCHELQNLVIPEGVTSIGDGAFYGCTYLEDLVLPSSVHTIGDNTFALCSKMKKIVVNAPVPPSIQAKTFYDVKRQIPVYVPDNCVTAYENDAQWGEFNIQGINNMPSGIEETNIDIRAQKIFRDGQVLILRGDKTYTLQGQEIK